MNKIYGLSHLGPLEAGPGCAEAGIEESTEIVKVLYNALFRIWFTREMFLRIFTHIRIYANRFLLGISHL